MDGRDDDDDCSVGGRGGGDGGTSRLDVVPTSTQLTDATRSLSLSLSLSLPLSLSLGLSKAEPPRGTRMPPNSMLYLTRSSHEPNEDCIDPISTASTATSVLRILAMDMLCYYTAALLHCCTAFR